MTQPQWNRREVEFRSFSCIVDIVWGVQDDDEFFHKHFRNNIDIVGISVTKWFYQAAFHRLLYIKRLCWSWAALLYQGGCYKQATRVYHLHYCCHMEGTFACHHFMLPSPSLQRRRGERGGEKGRRERGRLALSGCKTKMAVKTFCLLSLVLVVVSVAEY